MQQAFANNPTFWPTMPKEIAKMLEPFLKSIRHNYEKTWQILDPSAGSGGILDYLIETLKVKRSQLYAIEQDPELVYTLQGKGYKVIHNDFLTYQGDYLYDLIIMNPPFVNGDEHLLKAWEILKDGHIVCLLNEETILNPYTAKRKLLASIIEANGSIEYLGNCFSQADRKTDVRVVMVRLQKKETEARFTFNFIGKEKTVDFSEEIAGNQLAINDVTGTTLAQYEAVKSSYLDYIRAKKALTFYAQGLTGPYADVLKMADEHSKGEISEAYNGFVSKFKEEVWTIIIGKLGMKKMLTEGVKKDMNKYIKAQGAMDLTRENIFSLVEMLVENRVSIMDRALIDVFDVLVSYHEKNKLHVEGWKTNLAWKVNKKIILPNGVVYGSYLNASQIKAWGDNFGLPSHSRYEDIDKVMCYLTGKDYNKCLTIEMGLRAQFDRIGTVKPGEDFVNKGESDFFTFTFWKKGTIHLEFKDEKLWEEFNYRACKGKNFLPDESPKGRAKTRTEAPKEETALITVYNNQTQGGQILLFA